jgi:signal transduction histidine kinase
VRVRSRAAPIATSAAERAGRSRRWTTRTRKPIRANGFTGMAAVGGVLSNTTARYVNRTVFVSQALSGPLIEDTTRRWAASQTRCVPARMSSVARMGGDRLRADPSRMRQVFSNLLDNSLKFTPAGGRVEIRSANPKPDEVQVSVHDTGAGIAPHQIAHLFEPFEQAAAGYRGGLGLGLAIAKGLVDAHGGTIEASSQGNGQGRAPLSSLSPSPARLNTRRCCRGVPSPSAMAQRGAPWPNLNRDSSAGGCA